VGRATRPKPKRLAKKLEEIRTSLNLTQYEVAARLGATAKLTQAEISAFEKGKREPPLPVLLRYARIAGICVDVLIDDEADLPKKLPAKLRHRP
jgi:transcriptional regulator with XRE-family HTH domain